MEKPSDAQAIRLLRRRDPRGFELAYGAYAAELFSFLNRLTGDRSLAEDILQQVFLRLAERGPDLAPQSHLRGWLYAVARNAYLTQLRRTARWESEDALTNLPSYAPDAEAHLLLGDVEQALLRLRPEDREVLLLLSMDGLNREAAAALLGIDREALRKRLSRARARLLAELESTSLSSNRSPT
jgi:RNA polymerase sigma factor (sigma-70 family)